MRFITIHPASLFVLATALSGAACNRTPEAPAAAPPPAPSGDEAAAVAPAEPEAPAMAPALPQPAGWVVGKAADAKDVDLEALVGDASALRGQVATCTLLLAPTPVQMNEAERAAAAEQTGEALEDRRATLFCRASAEDMRSTSVVVWFPEGERGAILDLDRDSVAAIQIAGSYLNQPTAVYRGLVRGARRAAPDAKHPDLLTALLWPEKHLDQQVTCTASGLPTVAVVADDDAGAAIAGGDRPSRRGLLRCSDARGGSVGVVAYPAKGAEGTLLTIGDGSQVVVTLRGMHDNQLVARLGKVVAGALAGGAEGDALRRFVVDPTTALGKSLPCRALIAPSPRVGGADLEAGRALLREPIADGHVALACAAPGGSVPVVAFFRRDEADKMLLIGADSELSLSVWGLAQGRILARFEGVVRGGLAPPPREDWRALALSAAGAVGRKVGCEVLIRPFVGPSTAVASEKLALLGASPLGPRMAILGCKDHSQAAGGTRVEVYFSAAQDAHVDSIAAGSQVVLEVRGAVAGAVVTRWPAP